MNWVVAAYRRDLGSVEVRRPPYGPGRILRCQQHGTETRTATHDHREWARQPDLWCQECRAIVYGRP